MVELTVIHRDDPDGVEMLNAVRPRVFAFLNEHEPGTDPWVLWNEVLVGFHSEFPTTAIVAALDGRNPLNLVGHLLVQLNEWLGVRFVNVMQYELDSGQPISILKSGLDRVEAWARGAGVTRMRCCADSPALARVYRTYYGFRDTGKVIMEKEL